MNLVKKWASATIGLLFVAMMAWPAVPVGESALVPGQ
jgi:hypothetical protein